MKRFRGGLVFKAHTLCVSLNSRLESNKEEGESTRLGPYGGVQLFLPPELWGMRDQVHTPKLFAWKQVDFRFAWRQVAF